MNVAAAAAVNLPAGLDLHTIGFVREFGCACEYLCTCVCTYIRTYVGIIPTETMRVGVKFNERKRERMRRPVLQKLRIFKPGFFFLPANGGGTLHAKGIDSKETSNGSYFSYLG